MIESTYAKRGSVDHIKTYAANFNVPYDNKKVEIKINEEKFKDVLNLPYNLIGKICGKDYMDKVKDLLQKIKLKKPRTSFNIFLFSENEKEDKDKKEEKLNEKANQKSFAKRNSDKSAEWKKLSKHKKAPYEKQEKY